MILFTILFNGLYFSPTETPKTLKSANANTVATTPAIAGSRQAVSEAQRKLNTDPGLAAITVPPRPIVNAVSEAPTSTPAIPVLQLAQPQPLQSGQQLLIRLDAVQNKASLIEQLKGLEAIKEGRFQPLEYTPAKNGEAERLLAVINQNDKPGFAIAGLEYRELDLEVDTARYFKVLLPAENAPNRENWLDSNWQVLNRVGNQVIIKADLPIYIGFGFRAKLQIEKLPPRIFVPGLTLACPCPMLAAATFSVASPTVTPAQRNLKDLVEKISENNLRQLTDEFAQNEVTGKGNLNTRYSGGPGSVYAAERLYNYFFSLGLKVEYDNFVETAFGTLASNVVAEQTAEKEAEIDKPVLLVAHYDSLGERNLKGISNSKIPAYGTNDNALGVAGLMEIANLLASNRFKRSVRYIAFGAEEQGMLGSQHYAYSHLKSNPPSAVINLDSFGYNPGSEDWVVLAYDHKSLGLKDKLVEYDKKYKIELRLEIRQGEPFFRSDDYFFSELGYSAVALTDSFSIQSPNNHTSNDTIANINFRTARKVVQLALVTVGELAGSN